MATVVIPRGTWGARYPDGCRSAPLPAEEVWLHHSVTTAPADSPADEQAAMRALERIGQSRFGCGISYTWCIPPSGRVYQGHTPGRQGTHTGGRNDRARAICLIGNYDQQRPTDAQLSAAAALLRHAEAQGWITGALLNGGHRDLKPTACPGRYAYAQIGEINRRAQEDDMPSADDIARAVWAHRLDDNTADRTLSAGQFQRYVYAAVRKLAAQQLDARDIARAVVEELPEGGVDEAVVERAIRRVFGELDEAAS